MIIKALDIENVGRHAHIQFDSDSSVVGLIGPNGSGKSTIMSMVEFLVTGEVDGALPTYVRNYEGNGKVWMRFQKDGKEGTIFRRFGKSTKRELHWDGEKFTAAKQVDAKLTEIFGVDKRAISSAVFINQGLLESILFASYKDRRTAFIQLVNLAFCAYRVRQIDGHIKSIQSTIEDLTPLWDARQAELNEATENLSSLQQQVEQHQDYANEIGWLSELIKEWESQNQSIDAFNQNRIQGEQLERQTNEMLQSLGYESLDAMTAARDSWEASIHEQWNQIRSLQQIARDINTLEENRRHYQNLDGEIRNMRYRYQEQDPGEKGTEELESRRQQLTDLYHRLARRDEIQQELQGAQKEFRESLKRLNEIYQTKQDPETLQAKRQELEKASNELAKLEGNKRFQDEIRGMLDEESKQQETLPCPKCGLEVVSKRLLAEDEQAALDANLQNASQHKETLAKEVSDLETAIYNQQKQEQELATTTRSVGDRIESLKYQLGQIPSDKTKDQVEQEIADLDNRLKEIRSLGEQIRSATNQQSQLLRYNRQCSEGAQKISELTGWSEEAIYNMDYGDHPGLQTLKAQVSEEAIRDAQQKVQADEGRLKQVRDGCNQLTNLNSRLESIRSEAGRLEGILNQSRQRAKQLIEQLNPFGIDLDFDQEEAVVYDPIEEARSSLAKLQSYQEELQVLRGRRDEARQSYDSALARYQDIKKRAEKDAKKQEVLADLRTLKDALSEDELPMDYVRYQFEHLARLTQEALITLNANFAIEIDRENELAFQFTRLDEDNPVVLPMEKLSGGQRVMLCIAFLIAVQKQLVSNVGLLVLDEPSIHCDDEAVDNLVELLSDMQRQLKNTEMQIWISDHNPKLQTSMQKVLQLS